MSNTSVTTGPAPVAGASVVTPTPVPPTRNKPRPVLLRGLKFLASLELTCVLFVLSLFLVFFGTLAQIDNGIWTVVDKYFRSGYVWVPLRLFVQFAQVFLGVSNKASLPGSFPFPGGYTLGALLLVNLLAAHLVRFKLSWKRSGILLVHFGLILLLLGELGTREFGVEQRMTIANGETVNFTDINQQIELAITSADPENPGMDRVVTVPDRFLRKPGNVSDEQLPFDIEVVEVWKNSNLIQPSEKVRTLPNERQALDGKRYGVSNEGESSGVDTEAREDYPSAKIICYEKGTDNVLGKFLVSLWYYSNRVHRQIEFPPQELTVGGRVYSIELRPKREYKPFSLTLKEFKHDLYPGTTTPKNFSSKVEFKQDEKGPGRDVLISMNSPMRYRNEAFFQSGYFPDDSGTILQVVRNPVWLAPYLSCAFVTLGMLVHFGMTLITFLKRVLA